MPIARPIPNSDACFFFTITTLGLHSPAPTMGRKSTDSTTQAKTKTKSSGSTPSRTSKLAKTSTPTSDGTQDPKPSSMSSKQPRAVESNEVEVGGHSGGPPTKRNKTTVASTTAKKSFGDIPKPSTSKKDVRPKSKPVKPTLTAANPGGSSGPGSDRKRQKAVPEPVEAESEESEEEWVGFGGAGEESSEGDEQEVESEEEGSGYSSEGDLLHGLSSDDDQDSSDEEVDLPGIDISKLPTIAKDDKIVKQKLEKAKRQPVCVAFTITLFSSVV